MWELCDRKVEANLHTLQGGFRKQRGVIEQLGLLRIISENSIVNKKPLYTACLDIKKAYDTVWRDSILYKLKHKFNIENKLLAIIQNMLLDTSSGLKNENELLINPFDTTLGVVQGSVLSPILYGVFINDLVEELDDSKLGTTYQQHHIPCLLYCDDIILTANDQASIIALLKICERHSKKWNYAFNPTKCNIITNNVQEPLQNLILHRNRKREQLIQKEYLNQMPFYYKNSSIIVQQTAPLILQKYFFETHHVHGYDTKGIMRYWSINVFNKKLRKTIYDFFVANKDITHIQFLIHWQNLKPSFISKKAQFRSITKLYNKKLKYKNTCRYLGAQLCDQNPLGIISDKKTNKSFVKRMFAKEHQLLHNLQLNYVRIHLNIKLPLIKTFFLAYTEIFSQVLPTQNLKKLDDISIKTQIKLCQIYPKRVDHHQFRIFIGIPSPSQRWIMTKLLYYYKMVNNPKHTIYSQLMNECLDNKLPIFKQTKKLIETWIPDITKTLMRNQKEYPMKKYRQEIIKKLTAYNLKKLNIYHPFKEIKFVTSAYIPFYITNIERISKHYPHIKKSHLTKYYELFYYFGWFGKKSNNTKFCRLCNFRVKKSITQHVLCNCKQLNNIRTSYFNRVHNELIEVYNSPDTTHQRLFAFHILQLLEKTNNNNNKLWQIICGMNFYNTHDETFYYNSNIKSDILSYLGFLDTLIGYLASWTTICKSIYNDPHKIKFRNNYAEKSYVPLNYRYPMYLYNNTEVHKYMNNTNIETYSNHITVFTDGAHIYDEEEKYENNDIASIGIFISYKNTQYLFCQAIGAQSIYFAEMYAVAIVLDLMIKLNLPTEIPIDIFCDNQTVIENIYKTPKFPSFPNMLYKCQQMIEKKNVIIHKVKSHEPNDEIIGNKIADEAADYAIKYNFCRRVPTPFYEWINSKAVRKDFGCYGQTDQILWDLFDPG